MLSTVNLHMKKYNWEMISHEKPEGEVGKRIWGMSVGLID